MGDGGELGGGLDCEEGEGQVAVVVLGEVKKRVKSLRRYICSAKDGVERCAFCD